MALVLRRPGRCLLFVSPRCSSCARLGLGLNTPPVGARRRRRRHRGHAPHTHPGPPPPLHPGTTRGRW
jgi:hypothetical protein